MASPANRSPSKSPVKEIKLDIKKIEEDVLEENKATIYQSNASSPRAMPQSPKKYE